MAFSGEKLRQIRLMRGLSQRDLPVAHDTVSRIESGRRTPHPSTLRKLAEALGVEVHDFFDEPVATPKKPPLPDDFDVVTLTQEVATEHPELPQHEAEFRNLVYKRFTERLGHLSREELKAIESGLEARSLEFDKSLDSPLWRDPDRLGEWMRLFDERKAVQLALSALDRVLAEA